MNNQSEINVQASKVDDLQSIQSQQSINDIMDMNELRKMLLIQNQVIVKLEKQNQRFKESQSKQELEYKGVDTNIDNNLNTNTPHSFYKNDTQKDNTQSEKNSQDSSHSNGLYEGMQAIANVINKQNKKYVDLMPFDDEKGNIYKWLEAFDLQVKRLGLSEQEAINECNYLLPKRVRAQIEGTKFRSFNEMSIFIKQSNQQDRHILETEYYSLEKKVSESYVSFNKRLLEIAEQLDMSEGQHLSRFIMALPTPIKEDLIDYRYKDASSLAKILDLKIKRDSNKESNSELQQQIQYLNQQMQTLQKQFERQGISQRNDNYQQRPQNQYQGNNNYQQRSQNQYQGATQNQNRNSYNQNGSYNQGRGNYNGQGRDNRYQNQHQNKNQYTSNTYGQNKGNQGANSQNHDRNNNRYNNQQNKQDNNIIDQHKESYTNDPPAKQDLQEFITQKAQLVDKDLVTTSQTFLNSNHDKSIMMANYDFDDADDYNLSLPQLQAIAQDLNELKTDLRRDKPNIQENVVQNQGEQFQSAINLLVSDVNDDLLEVDEYINQLQARRTLYPCESYQESIYEVLNKRKEREDSAEQEEKQQNPRERTDLYNFRNLSSQKGQGNTQKEQNVNQENDNSKNRNFAKEGLNKQQFAPKTPNLEQLRRNLKMRGNTMQQREDGRNWTNGKQDNRFLIPSNISCKDKDSIDWSSIANQIECALPLPLLMKLEQLKLVDQNGIQKDLSQQYTNYNVSNVDHSQNHSKQNDKLNPLLDYISQIPSKGYHLTIPLEVKDVYFPALVDGGSTISIISYETCQALKLESRMSINNDAFGTLGGPTTSIGVIQQLLFKLGGIQSTWNFFVVDFHNRSFDFLLGSDFLRSCHGTIDYGVNTFMFTTEQGNKYMVKGNQPNIKKNQSLLENQQMQQAYTIFDGDFYPQNSIDTIQLAQELFPIEGIEQGFDQKAVNPFYRENSLAKSINHTRIDTQVIQLRSEPVKDTFINPCTSGSQNERKTKLQTHIIESCFLQPTQSICQIPIFEDIFFVGEQAQLPQGIQRDQSSETDQIVQEMQQFLDVMEQRQQNYEEEQAIQNVVVIEVGIVRDVANEIGSWAMVVYKQDTLAKLFRYARYYPIPESQSIGEIGHVIAPVFIQIFYLLQQNKLTTEHILKFIVDDLQLYTQFQNYKAQMQPYPHQLVRGTGDNNATDLTKVLMEAMQEYARRDPQIDISNEQYQSSEANEWLNQNSIQGSQNSLNTSSSMSDIVPQRANEEECNVILMEDKELDEQPAKYQEYDVAIYTERYQNFLFWAMVLYYKGVKLQQHGGITPLLETTTYQEAQVLGLIGVFGKIYDSMYKHGTLQKSKGIEISTQNKEMEFVLLLAKRKLYKLMDNQLQKELQVLIEACNFRDFTSALGTEGAKMLVHLLIEAKQYEMRMLGNSLQESGPSTRSLQMQKWFRDQNHEQNYKPNQDNDHVSNNNNNQYTPTKLMHEIKLNKQQTDQPINRQENELSTQAQISLHLSELQNLIFKEHAIFQQSTESSRFSSEGCFVIDTNLTEIQDGLLEDVMVLIEDDPCLTNSEIHVDKNNLALHFAIEPYTSVAVWAMIIYIDGRRRYQYGQCIHPSTQGIQDQNLSLLRKVVALQAMQHYESVRETLLPNQNQICICVEDSMLQILFQDAMDENRSNNHLTLRQLHLMLKNINCQETLLFQNIGETKALTYMFMDSKVKELADDLEIQVSREQTQISRQQVQIRQRQQLQSNQQFRGQREQQAQVYREVQRRSQLFPLPTVYEYGIATPNLSMFERQRIQEQQARTEQQGLPQGMSWIIDQKSTDVELIQPFPQTKPLQLIEPLKQQRMDEDIIQPNLSDQQLEQTSTNTIEICNPFVSTSSDEETNVIQLVDYSQVHRYSGTYQREQINPATFSNQALEISEMGSIFSDDQSFGDQSALLDWYENSTYLMDVDEDEVIEEYDYTLLFDGSSTKLASAIAYVLYKGDRKVAQHAQFVSQELTNNEVEYQALLISLQHLIRKRIQNKKILIVGDSQLVVNQVLQTYKVKEERLDRILNRIKEHIKSFPNLTLQHIRRQLNQEPNDLAQALTSAKELELLDFYEGLKSQQQSQRLMEQQQESIEDQLHQLYPNFPRESYDLIIMDPPYKHPQKINGSPTYPTLNENQLKVLPIAEVLTKNGVVLLWSPGPFIKQSIALINFWGLKFINIILVWRKVNSKGAPYNGLGLITSHNYEFLLLATNGDLTKSLREATKLSQELCTIEVQQEVMLHSEKPREFYQKIKEIFKVEQMKCIEIFNRGRNLENQFLDLYGNELLNYFQPKESTQEFEDIEEELSLITQENQFEVMTNNILKKDTEECTKDLLRELNYDEDITQKLCQLKVGDKLVPKTQEMYQILTDFMDVFCWRYPQDLIGTRTIEHRFDLKPGSQPIAKKFYRVTQEKDQFIQDQLDELLSAGMIEPSASPYAAPVVLREKKDKSLRMCIDFKGLNKQTIPDKYPMQRNDECLDLLQGKVFFVTLDLKAGFWQIFIANDQRYLTTFIVRQGIFQWVRMPFGLINAPATQQRLMDIVLKGLIRTACLVYIDDVIIYGKTLQELYRNLRQVLQRLREHGLKLNQKKCQFFTRDKVEFLGHLISEGKIQPQPDKIENILKIQLPQNHKQMRQFLGSVNYIRRFIPNVDVLLKPLSKMTRSTKPFQWNEEAKQSFEDVKKVLATQPRLCLPDYTKEFVVHTFWNQNTGLYAVLTQLDPKTRVEEPIEYAAKSITESQEKYAANEGQLYCIIWAIQKWEYILHNKHFTIVVEQNAIKWILDNPPTKSKLAKWAIIIQQFDFSVETRANRQNRAMLTKLMQSYKRQQENLENFMMTDYDLVNSLYCQICKEQNEENPMVLCDNCNNGYHLTCIGMTSVPQGYWYCQECLSQILENKSIDPTQDLEMLDYLEHGYLDETLNPNQKDQIKLKASNYVYQDNTLYIKCETTDGQSQFKEIPPIGNRALLIIQLHRNIGHLGLRKTLGVVLRWYYWPFIIRDVKQTLKGCLVCQAQSAKYYDIPGVYPTKIQQGPFTLISLDCITGLKETQRGNTAIVVAIDAYSKWVEARAIPNLTSTTITKFFLEDILSRFGAPLAIKTDNGSEFKGDLSKMLQVCGIKQILTTPYYKQANGLVERMNRTIQNSLRKLYQQPGFEQEWDECLPWTLLGIRATIARGTNYSPYQVIYGRDMVIPGFIIDHQELIEWNEPQNEEILSHIMTTLRTHDQQKKRIEEGLQEMYQEIEKDLQNKRNPTIYDFELGDLVYVQQWRKTKLDLRSIGPYVFLRYNDDRKLSATIYNQSSKRELKVSTSNLAPCKIL